MGWTRMARPHSHGSEQLRPWASSEAGFRLPTEVNGCSQPSPRDISPQPW